ncbi:uncharacterized protein LOC124170425 [Ischnura elegans]|uniref:uncharacterized protein LOC124170425 n=1 Tax=Ischnura elegans TaxID=197161 RepID=UPI001ED87E2B|nr:uncharacterized protein LOC124170425 [Ischnura elegans]
MEELKNTIACNRVPVAKIRNFSDHESDSEDEPLAKKKRGNRMAQAEKKMKTAAAGEEKCKAILAERKRELLQSPLMLSRKSFTDCSSDSDSEDEVVPKKLLLDSEAKYHRLKKNFLELKKREEENKKDAEELKLFKGKVEVLEEENKILKRLNFQLQEEVIQHFKSGTTMEVLDKEKTSQEMPDITTEEDLIAEDGYVSGFTK